MKLVATFQKQLLFCCPVGECTQKNYWDAIVAHLKIVHDCNDEQIRTFTMRKKVIICKSFTCQVCKRSFTNIDACREHQTKYHQKDSVEELEKEIEKNETKKSYMTQALPLINKPETSNKFIYKHESVNHGASCLISGCNYLNRKKIFLLLHVKREHGLNFDIEYKQGKSEQEFWNWKKEREIATSSIFILKGKHKTMMDVKTEFCCPHECFKRERLQQYKKPVRKCSAFLKVSFDKETCRFLATACFQHFNHSHEYAASRIADRLYPPHQPDYEFPSLLGCSRMKEYNSIVLEETTSDEANTTSKKGTNRVDISAVKAKTYPRLLNQIPTDLSKKNQIENDQLFLIHDDYEESMKHMSTNDFLANMANSIIVPDEHNQDDASTSEPIVIDEKEVEITDMFDENTCEEHDFYGDEPPRPKTPPQRRSKNLSREIRGLSFANPGSEMSRFLPDSVDIISKTRAKRVNGVVKSSYDEAADPDCPVYYDRHGNLVTRHNGMVVDLCDCLALKCPGCQWPCTNCKSRKCGFICRQNRKEIITEIEEMHTVEGAKGHAITANPCLDGQF